MIYVLTRTTAYGSGDDPETEVLCVSEKDQCEKKFLKLVKNEEKNNDALILSKNEASWVDSDEDTITVLKIHKVKGGGREGSWIWV
jgi:hypothetical protein